MDKRQETRDQRLEKKGQETRAKRPEQEIRDKTLGTIDVILGTYS